jgi:hypothetical protein
MKFSSKKYDNMLSGIILSDNILSTDNMLSDKIMLSADNMLSDIISW